VGASNDHTVTEASAPGCQPTSASGPDRMFRFTLTEATGVRIDLWPDNFVFSASLALYDTVACDTPLVGRTSYGGRVGFNIPDADDEPDGRMDASLCLHNGFGGNVLDVDSLPAGDYWIVVDGAEGSEGSPSGTFELSLTELPAGLCVGGTTQLSEGREAGGSLRSHATRNVSRDAVACAADQDTLLFAHMGGTLDVNVEVLTVGESLDVVVHEAIVDPVQLMEALPSRPPTLIDPAFTRGAVIESGAVQPAGFYVLTVSGAARETAYHVDIVHECTGDRWDLAGGVDDADAPDLYAELLQRHSMLPGEEPITFGEPNEFMGTVEFGRTLCGGDEDLFVIAPEDQAPFSLVLHDATDLVVTWESVGVSGTGPSEPATAVETVDGAVRTFRVDAPEQFRVYRARVREQTPSAAQRVVPYQVFIDYPVLEPEQRCAQAPTIDFGVQTSGGLNGASRYESPCGDAAGMPPSVRADEEFYAFTLDVTTSVEVEISSATDVVFSIVSAPGHACTTAADLIPVSRTGAIPSAEGESLCTYVFPGTGTMVARDLPAGDYFLIVDGATTYATGGVYRPRAYWAAQGSVITTLTALAEVEEPVACTNALEVDVSSLATDGATVLVDVPLEDVTSGADATLYALPCSRPASYSERVLTFVAPASGTLTAHVEGDSWVRSMALVSGACDGRTQPDLETCAIYADVSAPVVEGERYWLQLDNDVFEAEAAARIALTLAP
jgi:hypothetical protein